MKKVGVIVIIVALVLVVVAGVFFFGKGNNSTQSDSSNDNVGTKSVSISDFAFSPSTLIVSIGDTVIWTNEDSAPHTVTSDSGSELNSATLSNGQTYSHIFSTAGEYDYHCSIHSMMKGKIIVE